MPRHKIMLTPEYDNQRQLVRNQFNRLPYGSRMQAAFDLRIPPVTISRVLNGLSAPRPAMLEQLQTWVNSQTP